MPEQFTRLIREYEEPIIRALVDGLYNDRRTELPARLSYGQLVNHLPELLEELGHVLDDRPERSAKSSKRRGVCAHMRRFAFIRAH